MIVNYFGTNAIIVTSIALGVAVVVAIAAITALQTLRASFIANEDLLSACDICSTAKKETCASGGLCAYTKINCSSDADCYDIPGHYEVDLSGANALGGVVNASGAGFMSCEAAFPSSQDTECSNDETKSVALKASKATLVAAPSASKGYAATFGSAADATIYEPHAQIENATLAGTLRVNDVLTVNSSADGTDDAAVYVSGDVQSTTISVDTAGSLSTERLVVVNDDEDFYVVVTPDGARFVENTFAGSETTASITAESGFSGMQTARCENATVAKLDVSNAADFLETAQSGAELWACVAHDECDNDNGKCLFNAPTTCNTDADCGDACFPVVASVTAFALPTVALPNAQGSALAPDTPNLLGFSSNMGQCKPRSSEDNVSCLGNINTIDGFNDTNSYHFNVFKGGVVGSSGLDGENDLYVTPCVDDDDNGCTNHMNAFCDTSDSAACLMQNYGGPWYDASAEEHGGASMHTPMFPYTCAQLAYSKEVNAPPSTLCIGQGVDFTLGGNDLIWDDQSREWIAAPRCGDPDNAVFSPHPVAAQKSHKTFADRCFSRVQIHI